jgi:hypothetical protein
MVLPAALKRESYALGTKPHAMASARSISGHRDSSRVSDGRAEPLFARERNVIEVERTRRWQAVVLGKNDLRIDAADRARRGHDNDLVQPRQHRIA